MQQNHKNVELLNGMFNATQNAKLNVKNVKNAISKLEKANLETWVLTNELAAEIGKGAEAFENLYTAYKNLCKDKNVKPLTKAEAIEKTYGFEASNYHKYVRLSAFPQNLINKYTDKVHEAKGEGLKASLSKENCETWCKNFDSHKGEAAADNDTIADMRKPSKDKIKRASIVAVFTLGKNKFTYYSDGTSDNQGYTAVELREVVNELQAHINSTFKIEQATKQAKTVAKRNATKLQAKKPVVKPELVTA
jgi:hypothetical protein